MIGTGELILILLVILVLFGGKKLPDLARNLGIGVREFKRACQGLDEEEETPISPKKTAPKEAKSIEEIPEDRS